MAATAPPESAEPTPATPDPSAPISREARLTLAVASLAVLAVFLDTTALFVAFPDIVATFDSVAPAQLSWVLNAYTIVIAALLIPAGKLADRLGHKRTFLFGSALFTVASMACGIAPSAGILIVFRVVQAFGAATLIPASLAIVLPVGLNTVLAGRRILREAFFGTTRFDDFRRNLAIPRSNLSARLATLVEHGILDRRSEPDTPGRPVYEITDKGRSLSPVMVALMQWGDQWSGIGEPPVTLLDHDTGTPLRELHIVRRINSEPRH